MHHEEIAPPSTPLLFSFGIIGDVQYADAPDGWDFHKTVLRRYQNSLTCLKGAVSHWQSSPHPITFVVQLGDLIDGKCKEDPQGTAQMILSEFKDFDVHNLIGNHELYVMRREWVNGVFNANRPLVDPSRAYYSFVPYKGWRFVVLDSYDFSTIQEDTKKEALEYLKRYNPNDVCSFGVDWTEGLVGEKRKYLPYNGGLSQKQLNWLTEQLTQATANKEKVIILSHIPLLMESAHPENILWNSAEVLAVLHSFGCVVACLAGHDHSEGYAVDGHGIHHLTFSSPLEVIEDLNAFGTFHVYPNKLVLEGNGMVSSRTWEF